MTLQTHIHASAASWKSKAVVLTGPSGSGKSDLLLRLLDSGFTFIGDDRLIVERRGETLLTMPEPALQGLFEVRGAGIMRLPYEAPVPVRLVIHCVNNELVERLPEAQEIECLGIFVPCIALNVFEASAVAKVRLLMSQPEKVHYLAKAG